MHALSGFDTLYGFPANSKCYSRGNEVNFVVQKHSFRYIFNRVLPRNCEDLFRRCFAFVKNGIVCSPMKVPFLLLGLWHQAKGNPRCLHASAVLSKTNFHSGKFFWRIFRIGFASESALFTENFTKINSQVWYFLNVLRTFTAQLMF